VAYRADQDADDVYELYLVSVASPGASTKLNAALTPDGWVRSGFTFSPDGVRVLYRADQDVAEQVELYLTTTAASGIAQKVNSSLVAGGDVHASFAFSPDGATIGYIADQDTDEMLELYAAAASTPGVTHKLNGALIAEGDVCRFKFSPNSARVAYCADQDVDGQLELYTTALTAPGQSVKLNPPLVAGGEVTSGYDFGADSAFMVYAAKQEAPDRTDLYRVDIGSPGVAARLNAPLVAGGNVVGHRLRVSDTHVGYVANQDDANVYELYEVSLQAPGVATKLSAAMQGSGVFNFRYTEEDAGVVYLADQDSDSSELYRVDLAAPGSSTKLNGALVAGGEVWDYELALP
jgi:hypothetical protein